MSRLALVAALLCAAVAAGSPGTAEDRQLEAWAKARGAQVRLTGAASTPRRPAVPTTCARRPPHRHVAFTTATE
jgi:hypothetical protein